MPLPALPYDADVACEREKLEDAEKARVHTEAAERATHERLRQKFGNYHLDVVGR